MPNNLKARPIADEIFSKMQELGFSKVAAYAFRDSVVRSDLALTNLGELQSVAPVKGRTEGIGTTVVNHNSDGTFNSTDNVHDGISTLRTYQQSGALSIIDNAGFEAALIGGQIPGWSVG